MSAPRVLASGLRFPEGPCVAADGSLVVVELAAGRVTRIRDDGARETVARTGGSPNGAAFAPDGTLLVANAGGRWFPAPSTGDRPGPGGGPEAIQRIAFDGAVETVLDAIDGVPLYAPNDLCFDVAGGCWFSDPAWPDPEMRIPPGAVCWLGPDGTARRAHVGLQFPNGVALTEDGDTLLVAETGTGLLHAFDVVGPGVLGERRAIASLGADSLPDGMCLDVEGRILLCLAGTRRLVVLPPGGGDPIEEVSIPAGATNACFGGPDHRHLYVTASHDGDVVVVERDVAGLRLPHERG